MIDKFPGTPAKSLNLLMLMMLMMLMPRLSLLRYALCIFHAEKLNKNTNYFLHKFQIYVYSEQFFGVPVV